MTPIDISLISRKVASRSKVRRIYLISEGTLTEPSFLKSVLTDSPYLDNQLDMDFYATERSDKEFGINIIQGMVDLAYANIINSKMLWYGGINPCVSSDQYGFIMRINDRAVVENLMREINGHKYSG